jgi:hypothetical protein
MMIDVAVDGDGEREEGKGKCEKCAMIPFSLSIVLVV